MNLGDGIVGKIGGYDIDMLLSFEEGQRIDGEYRYLPTDSYLRLEGIYLNDGIFYMKEIDDNGVVTGIFYGRIINDRITGFWQHPTKDTR